MLNVFCEENLLEVHSKSLNVVRILQSLLLKPSIKQGLCYSLKTPYIFFMFLRARKKSVK